MRVNSRKVGHPANYGGAQFRKKNIAKLIYRNKAITISLKRFLDFLYFTKPQKLTTKKKLSVAGIQMNAAKSK